MYENWRYNPFTGQMNSIVITDEIHIIAYQSDWNAYGIQLNEAPQLTSPSSLTVLLVSDDTPFTEVGRSVSPSSGQFRVDYEAASFYATGRIEFNSADNGKAVKVSYKGTGWTVVKSNDYDIWRQSAYQHMSVYKPVPYGRPYQRIVYGVGALVAVGNHASALRSTDKGQTWSEVAAVGGVSPSWSGLAYGDGVFVAVGEGDPTYRVMRSTDLGLTWQGVAVDLQYWKSVKYCDGVFIAVANWTSGGTHLVMRSTDLGQSWSPVLAAEKNSWYDLAYGGGVIVAIAGALGSGTHQVMRSTDLGLTWFPIAAAEANVWNRVAYGNGVFVAVASSGTNRIMRSTDLGLTWSPIAAVEPGSLNGAAYGNGVFLITGPLTGTSSVMRSIDYGETWQAIERITALSGVSYNYSDITYFDGRFVSISNEPSSSVKYIINMSDYFPDVLG